MKTKDIALCLRAVNYSDTSQVVTLLTREHGKTAAMAKGARRPKSPFDGALEPFSFGPVVFVASETHDKLAVLTEFAQSARFRPLRGNLAAMHAGLFALELTEAFCQDSDPHPALFDALVRTLDALACGGDSSGVLAVLIGYQTALLNEAGIAPLLEVCANCRAPADAPGRELYFSSAANGVLCGGCEQSFAEKRRISPACAALLAGRIPADRPAAAVLTEAEDLLIYHFTELMHRRPKTAKYFVSR